MFISSPRIQAGCTLVHFGVNSSFVRDSVCDSMIASLHPPLFSRICELLPSVAAKELAVQAYEDRLLDQLLIEEAPEVEEDEGDENAKSKEESKELVVKAGGDEVDEEEEETEAQKVAKQRAKKLAEQAEADRMEMLALKKVTKKVPITENKGLIKTIQLTKKGEVKKNYYHQYLSHSIWIMNIYICIFKKFNNKFLYCVTI
jgi:hypothetical protein